MTLKQVDPKNIKIWTTEVKRVMMWPWGVEKQVRPKWEWTPWVNTILYMPFDTDLLDHSGNNISFTTLWTAPVISNWVSVWDWQWFLYTSPLTSQYASNHIFTVSWWVNLSTTASYVWWVSDNSYPSYKWRNSLPLTTYWRMENVSNQHQALSSTPISSFLNTWKLVTVVWNGGVAKMYINWTLETTDNNMSFTDWTFAFSVWKSIFRNADLTVSSGVFQWKMSQLILENKEWLDWEIQTYYNRTKANYWIS